MSTYLSDKMSLNAEQGPEPPSRKVLCWACGTEVTMEDPNPDTNPLVREVRIEMTKNNGQIGPKKNWHQHTSKLLGPGHTFSVPVYTTLNRIPYLSAKTTSDLVPHSTPNPQIPVQKCPLQLSRRRLIPPIHSGRLHSDQDRLPQNPHRQMMIRQAALLPLPRTLLDLWRPCYWSVVRY